MGSTFQYIVVHLHAITFKWYKPRFFLLVDTLRIIYLALYQGVFQYGLFVWGGLTESGLKHLQLQQGQAYKALLKKTLKYIMYCH